MTERDWFEMREQWIDGAARVENGAMTTQRRQAEEARIVEDLRQERERVIAKPKPPIKSFSELHPNIPSIPER